MSTTVRGLRRAEERKFKASKGCLASYVKCYSLKNLKITGESAFPEELKKLTEEKGYLPEKVFNCDETGLFGNKMSNHAYIHNSTKQAPGALGLER